MNHCSSFHQPLCRRPLGFNNRTISCELNLSEVKWWFLFCFFFVISEKQKLLFGNSHQRFQPPTDSSHSSPSTCVSWIRDVSQCVQVVCEEQVQYRLPLLTDWFKSPAWLSDGRGSLSLQSIIKREVCFRKSSLSEQVLPCRSHCVCVHACVCVCSFVLNLLTVWAGLQSGLHFCLYLLF